MWLIIVLVVLVILLLVTNIRGGSAGDRVRH